MRVRGSRSRWKWRYVAALIVMVQAGIPQRAFAQRRVETLPGLRFGPPLRAGFAFGAGYGGPLGPFPFAGPLVLGEVALGGARASAGYLFAGPFASGLEVLGSAMHTWRSPAQLEPGQTLVGGEFRATFFLVNAGLGVFRPVAGFENDRRTRYYLNVGLGI
jgi:hypothetical protein